MTPGRIRCWIRCLNGLWQSWYGTEKCPGPDGPGQGLVLSPFGPDFIFWGAFLRKGFAAPMAFLCGRMAGLCHWVCALQDELRYPQRAFECGFPQQVFLKEVIYMNEAHTERFMPLAKNWIRMRLTRGRHFTGPEIRRAIADDAAFLPCATTAKTTAFNLSGNCGHCGCPFS